LAATAFLDAKEMSSWKSTKSALAIGVPGTIAGVLWYIKKLGSLPIEEI
jgi:gamma-glutamyltranspeptidase/glutathione hydrolase